MTTLTELTDWLATELTTTLSVPVVLQYPGYGRPVANEQGVSLSLIRIGPSQIAFGNNGFVADYNINIHIADEYDFQSLLTSFLTWTRTVTELTGTELSFTEGNRVEYIDLEVGGSRFDIVLSIQF